VLKVSCILGKLLNAFGWLIAVYIRRGIENMYEVIVTGKASFLSYLGIKNTQFEQVEYL